MLVQPVAFPLANPLLTLETGLAYTRRPRTGSARNRSLGPRSWPDMTVWYRRSNSCPIADRLEWKKDWAGPCANPAFAMCKLCDLEDVTQMMGALIFPFLNEHNNTGLTGLVQGLKMITYSRVVSAQLMLTKSDLNGDHGAGNWSHRFHRTLRCPRSHRTAIEGFRS